MSFFNTTLKRNSKLDLSKPDLLKLVSMLEGELQAREITIAVLKSEQIKRLLYPLQSLPSSKQQISGFKTTRQIDDCQLNSNQLSELTAEQTIKYSIDPLIALSRDSFAIYDPSLDYRTTLALYNIKTFQLENLINNQRRLHLKANDRIKTLENQYENLLNEYEKEKAKNNVNKNKNDSNDHDNDDRIEQDEKIKELTQQLNETKENMKQIVLSLLNERKQLILRLIDEKHQNDQLEQTLNMEKRKMAEMVEGLEDESKRSLQMEAELEKYMTDFEKERQEFRQKLETNEAKNKALVLENDRLRKLVEQLQAQLSDGSKILSKTISSNNIDQEKWNLGEGVRSSIVTTMPVGPKVQSFSSVNPVFHPKASVAQPIPPITAANNLNKGTATAHSVTATAKSIQDVNSNTILPPPSIPVPQPKQQQQQQSNHCTIANSCTKNKSTTTIAADHVDEKNDDIDKSSKQQIDTSVKQTVMFYENSVKTATKATTTTAATVIAAPVTTTVSSTTASTLSSVSTTGTMVKKPSSGQRPIPPPIPPNKPTIRPVLPHQALLSFTKSNINNNINNNNTKDSNAITNHSNNNNNNNNKITNPSKTTTTINKVNTNNTNKSPTITNNSANNAQQQQQKQGTTTTLSLLKKFSFDGKS